MYGQRRGIHGRTIIVIAIAAVLGLAACHPTKQGTTTGPIDFEDPPYTAPADIDGQDGWTSTGAFDHEVDDVAASGTTPGTFGFGDQALRISSAVTSGSFGDQTFSRQTDDGAGETTAEDDGDDDARRGFFETSWDFATAGNPVAAAQSGLHVVASPDRGDGARMSWIEMADCSATIPAESAFVHECQQGNDGLEVNFYEYDADQTTEDFPGEGKFIFHNVATGLDREEAHDIRVRMWFFEGADNDVVEVCVDTTTCFVGNSWEDYFREQELNPTRTVDSVLFRTAGTANPGTSGNGFFIDNFNASAYTYTEAALRLTGPANVTEGNAGTTNATYTVTLDQVLPFPVTVDYDANSGTATAGSDFAVTSGTLTFAPGDTSETFDVPINGDTTDETHEQFTASISNAQSVPLEDAGAPSSTGGYARIHTGSRSTNINDDDSTLRVGDRTDDEPASGPANFPFVVTLDNPSAVTVTVNFSTVNGSASAPADFNAVNNRVLTFTPGQTSKSPVVGVKSDALVEGNETFGVILTSPTNASLGDSTGAAVILDEDD
jgi:hypothetical protein